MMFAEMSIDWRWVAGVIFAASISWIGRLQRDVNELRAQITEMRKRERLFEQPIPSDGSEEQMQVIEARELARRQGIKLSFYQAALIVARVREDKEKMKAQSKPA